MEMEKRDDDGVERGLAEVAEAEVEDGGVRALQHAHKLTPH
jgi:hypothetical protein